MGLCVKYSQRETFDGSILLDLGVKLVRDHVEWRSIETTPGVYTLPGDFVTRLNFYKANGITLVFILGYDNAVAYSGDPITGPFSFTYHHGTR